MKIDKEQKESEEKPKKNKENKWKTRKKERKVYDILTQSKPRHGMKLMQSWWDFKIASIYK